MNGCEKAGNNINNPSALMAQRGSEELSKSNTYNHADAFQVSSFRNHSSMNY